KGANPPRVLQPPVRNLRYALRDLDVGAVRSLMGRIDIEIGSASNLDSAAAQLAREEVRERIRRIFGIANFSYAGRAPHDFDALASAILTDLGATQARSFRVSARPADKRIPFPSPEIDREVGGRIKEAKGWRVDLEDPALTIHLE